MDMSQAAKTNDWKKPLAMAIPKEGCCKLEMGRYSPSYSRAPACHSVAMIANIKPGREENVRAYGGVSTVVTLFVFVSMLSIATQARAQTVNTYPGAPPVGNSYATRETTAKLNDGPDAQPVMGFVPQHRGGMERFHLLAAAESNTDSAASGAPSGGQAQNEAELAKKLQNPIASLISVPIQSNWDFGIGAADAMRYTANIQPVIPLTLSQDWNLIIRTIIPVIYAASPIPGGDNKAGLGDITQSFFFSPKEPTSGGWIWGIGPAFLYPSATDDALGTNKFGLGPTAVVLKQQYGWTYGMLFNHIWSVAGNSHRDDVNATFMQPFVAYTTKKFTTFTFNTETTYDWEHHQGTVPLNWMVQQLVKLGEQPVAFQFGARYYGEKPAGGPDWGLRFTMTLLFPK